MNNIESTIKVGCTKCGLNGVICNNYANNLIGEYFNYWLSKVTINKDPKGYLDKNNIFDLINLRRMFNGITAVVLDYYSDDILTTKLLEIRQDYNGNPIYARAQINLGWNNYQEIEIYDWKLTQNEALFNSYQKAFGTLNKTTFKAIFVINNIEWVPSLLRLNSILFNIHELSEKNDINHNFINTLYVLKSNKKPTPEQLSNINTVISPDGTMLWAIDSNDGTLLGETNLSIKTSESNLSKWSGIKDELETWEQKFYQHAGISNSSQKAERENIGETLSRYSRVTAKEKAYFKYIEQFLSEYEKYFNIELDYEFDTSISDITSSATEQLTINNKPADDAFNNTETGDLNE